MVACRFLNFQSHRNKRKGQKVFPFNFSKAYIFILDISFEIPQSWKFQKASTQRPKFSRCRDQAFQNSEQP